MIDFTFLEDEQIFGDNQLEIFAKSGTISEISDFAILLGGYASYENLTDNGFLAGWWWTKTPYEDLGVRVVCDDGSSDYDSTNERVGGARPVCNYDSILSQTMNETTNKDNVLEVEFGEYPQSIVDENLSKSIEEEYINGIIRKTGKKYVVDSVKLGVNTTKFQPKTYLEYEYKENKYVRVVGDGLALGNLLSDGKMVESGDVFWVKVEPIKWLVDEKDNIAVSKKILFSGVPFSSRKKYDGVFENTRIYKYLDGNFSKQIEPSIFKELSVEEQRKIDNYYKEESKRRNIYNFDFETISTDFALKTMIENNIALFLHGNTAEGKKSRVKKVDPDCIEVFLPTASKESMIGKNIYDFNTGYEHFVKPLWLQNIEQKCSLEPTDIHILFLDNLTNAPDYIKASVLEMIVTKKVNNIWNLPDNVRIVASGDVKEMDVDNPINKMIFDCFAHLYIQNSLDSWLEWASANDIHPAICSYIAYKKGETLRTDYDGINVNADPKKWEVASDLLIKTNRPDLLRLIVGDNIAKDFLDFCSQRVITVDDVLYDKYQEKDLKMTDAGKYITTISLAQVEEKNLSKVRNFVSGFGSNFCDLFDMFWISGDDSKREIINGIRNQEKEMKVLKKTQN